MHGAHPAQARTRINITMKKPMVRDVVGLLCSTHSCCYRFERFWDPDVMEAKINGTRLMLRNQMSRTAATGLSPNSVIFTRHVNELLDLLASSSSKDCCVARSFCARVQVG